MKRVKEEIYRTFCGKTHGKYGKNMERKESWVNRLLESFYKSFLGFSERRFWVIIWFIISVAREYIFVNPL